MEKTKYLTPEEAADLINENYTSRSRQSIMYVNAKKGNIKPVFPELAIVENGKIVQIIGESKERFFLRSEVELYTKKKQGKENYKNPRIIGFEVTFPDGTKKEFKDVATGSEQLDIKYHTLYRAVHLEKSIGGYKFKKL